jgi:hypothetical protein
VNWMITLGILTPLIIIVVIVAIFLFKKRMNDEDSKEKGGKGETKPTPAKKRSYGWVGWAVAAVLVGFLIYAGVNRQEKEATRTPPSPITHFRPGSPPPTPAEYEGLITGASEKYGVDANLIKAVIQQESGWDQNTVGTSGEKGLMQIMPETGARYGLVNDEDFFNPEKNIDVGTHYLSDLLKRYNGDTKKAISAYNTGEDNVDKGIVPFKTRNEYVPSVLALYEQYRGGAPIPIFTGGGGTLLAMAATPGKVLSTTTEVIATPNQWSENISIPSNARFRIEPKGKVQYRFWDGKIINDEPGKDIWFKDCIRNGNFRVLSREDHDVKVIVNVGPA